jgi:hypothetical protein
MKAWLEGHNFDLDTLHELFPNGEAIVAKDASGRYYLESPALENPEGQVDTDAAEALLKRINGAARAIDHSYQPVKLKGHYTGPDGAAFVSGPTATQMIRPNQRATVLHLRNGVPVPKSPPKGPRYVRLAEQDPNVADALRILGQPEPLDWYDIYKIFEIVQNVVGGPKEIEKGGWAREADLDRLKASANHPGISGDEARHARMKGTPGPDKGMTIREADDLIRRLVANWIESHPSY